MYFPLCFFKFYSTRPSNYIQAKQQPTDHYKYSKNHPYYPTFTNPNNNFITRHDDRKYDQNIENINVFSNQNYEKISQLYTEDYFDPNSSHQNITTYSDSMHNEIVSDLAGFRFYPRPL